MPARLHCSTPSVRSDTGSGGRIQEGFKDIRQDSHRTSVACLSKEDRERMEKVSFDC